MPSISIVGMWTRSDSASLRDRADKAIERIKGAATSDDATQAHADFVAQLDRLYKNTTMEVSEYRRVFDRVDAVLVKRLA